MRSCWPHTTRPTTLELSLRPAAVRLTRPYCRGQRRTLCLLNRTSLPNLLPTAPASCPGPNSSAAGATRKLTTTPCLRSASQPASPKGTGCLAWLGLHALRPHTPPQTKSGASPHPRHPLETHSRDKLHGCPLSQSRHSRISLTTGSRPYLLSTRSLAHYHCVFFAVSAPLVSVPLASVSLRRLGAARPSLSTVSTAFASLHTCTPSILCTAFASLFCSAGLCASPPSRLGTTVFELHSRCTLAPPQSYAVHTAHFVSALGRCHVHLEPDGRRRRSKARTTSAKRNMTSCLDRVTSSKQQTTSAKQSTKHDVVQANHDVVQAKHDVSEAKHDVVSHAYCAASLRKAFFLFSRPLGGAAGGWGRRGRSSNSCAGPQTSAGSRRDCPF